MKIKVVAGIDEAGRGPLAGPVVAAAVILDQDNIPKGLRDSKKLSEKRRDELTVSILSSAKAIGVGIVHEQEIDRINILNATFKAMREAVADLETNPDRIMVDGNNKIPDLPIDQIAIVGGDDKVPEISAASIIAKTTRDKMMRSYDVLFPEYYFRAHKGYGSAKHMENLRENGRCPIHRRSFKPVSFTPNEHYKYYQNESAYGRMGEIIAGMFLIRNGYSLLAHRYHAGRKGELDLIATRNNGIFNSKTGASAKPDEIIFVEVKSFAGNADDTEALERVTPSKQKQIARIAEAYLHTRKIEQKECRFDIITINFSSPKPVIHHYKNAFLPL